MKCPFCQSDVIVKKGKTKTGTQRYQCKDCKKYFSENTKPRQKLDATCPKCQSSNIVRCGSTRGKRRLLCKDCNSRFYVEPVPVKLSRVNNITCPRCGKDIIIRCGKSTNNEQYYRCKSCRHKFLENPAYMHLTMEEKRLIKLYGINMNLPITQLAEHINRTRRTVSLFIKHFKLNY